jgi:hypothetical protein
MTCFFAGTKADGSALRDGSLFQKLATVKQPGVLGQEEHAVLCDSGSDNGVIQGVTMMLT